MKLMKLHAVALAATLFSVANAQNGPIVVTVDGNPVAFSDVQPTRIDGKVMVPIRSVLEYAGASVVWDPSTNSAISDGARGRLEVQIGSSVYTVNGETRYLDSAPILSGGRTLVPMDLFADALGGRAELVADGSQVALTSEPAAQEAAPDSPMPTLSSIELSTHGWLKAGEPLTVELSGSSGCEAYFTIDGVDGRFPMAEQSPGRYTGTWMTPALPGLNLRDVQVNGYLQQGDSQASAVASDSISVDTFAPSIVVNKPIAGSRVDAENLVVSALVTDTGSGVDRSSLSLKVNGIDRTSELTWEDGKASWQPDFSEIERSMSITLRASDIAGNAIERSWNFQTGYQAYVW